MTIQVDDYDQTTGKEIVLLSSYECFIFDENNKKLKKSLKIKKGLGIRPHLLNIAEDGSMKIAELGGGFGDVGVVDESGKFYWKYKAEGTSPRMAVGDLDRDGNFEFYVADENGLHRLNESGKEIWKTDFWEDYVDIYDPGGNETSLIVTNGNDGHIRVRDIKGKLVKESLPEIRIYNIDIIKWPDNYNILGENGDYIIITDFNGKINFKYKLEERGLLGTFQIKDIRGIPIKLYADKKPYLAVITAFRGSSRRTMLSVFSPEGKLVYQELLRRNRGLAKVDNPDGSESLIVGDGNSKVWLYEMKK